MGKAKLLYGLLFIHWCTLSISQNILLKNSYGGKHAEFFTFLHIDKKLYNNPIQ